METSPVILQQVDLVKCKDLISTSVNSLICITFNSDSLKMSCDDNYLKSPYPVIFAVCFLISQFCPQLGLQRLRTCRFPVLSLCLFSSLCPVLVGDTVVPQPLHRVIPRCEGGAFRDHTGRGRAPTAVVSHHGRKGTMKGHRVCMNGLGSQCDAVSTG